MEITSQKSILSDEEEDLEFLRMAALQTLKSKAAAAANSHLSLNHNKFNGSLKHKRSRGYHSSSSRGGRNGQFNGRTRNTNLISIPIAQTEDNLSLKSTKPKEADTAPKLILPQDRYHGKSNYQEEGKSKGASSKFSRYDNSDDSESDEDLISEHSETESPKKLERACSLEALMQELEYEISGEKPPPPPPTKSKSKKQRTARMNSESEKEDFKSSHRRDQKERSVSRTEEKVEKRKEELSTKPIEALKDKSPLDEMMESADCRKLQSEKFTAPNEHRKSPSEQRKSPFESRKSPTEHRKSPSVHRKSPSERRKSPAERRKSPMERRKSPGEQRKSPKQRSRSPNYRKRSPLNGSRHLRHKNFHGRDHYNPQNPSARRITPSRRMSPMRPARRSSLDKKLSPKLRNPSPKPRNPSPKPRNPSPKPRTSSPKPKNSSPKVPVKDRLGSRNKIDDNKRKHSCSPDRNNKLAKGIDVAPKALNPVLEARRKKFEEQDSIPKEGIIRLKQKDSEKQSESDNDDAEDNVEEDDMLDLDTIDTHIDDIFSDEESDDENEGRFKSATSHTRNVSVLPFSAIVNGPKRDIKNRPLEEAKNHNNRRDRRFNRRRTDSRRKGSPSRKEDSKEPSRSRINSRKEANDVKVRVTSPIENNKKIEIKIRNPAKYESSSNYDVVNEDETSRKNKTSRKPAVTKENDGVKSNEPEIAIEEEVSDEDVKRKNDGGDLRAQLSRKRAERQNKLPVPEDVQSRLLQNALQGAVFKKSKKTKRKEKAAAPKEKLPIHLRLGLSSTTDVFTETTKKKKKSKGRNSDQV